MGLVEGVEKAYPFTTAQSSVAVCELVLPGEGCHLKQEALVLSVSRSNLYVACLKPRYRRNSSR